MNASKTFSIRVMTISALVALGIGAAATATASPIVETSSDGLKHFTVRFQELDLSTMAGATALYGRIQSAARAVCEPQHSRGVMMLSIYRKCVDQAIADAVARVDRPLLSAYHQSQIQGKDSGRVRLATAR